MQRNVIQGVFRPATISFHQAIKNRTQSGTVGAVKPGGAIQRSGAVGSESFQVNLRPASGGQTLPPEIQTKMESAFNADFSDVRIHVGREASSVGAIAFTWGSNLHFAPGQYNPHSVQGQQLIGHELAHVLQQRQGRVQNPFGSGVAVVQDRMLEAEADRMGWKAAMTQAPRQAAAVGHQGGASSAESSAAQPKIQPGGAHAAAQAQMRHPSPLSRRNQGSNPQVLQRRAAVIQMHTGINWGTPGVTAKPSKGGAMGGVMFVTVGATTHVVKAGKGSPASSLFAEQILKEVGGAKTTKSKPIPKSDPEFNQILGVLRVSQQADQGSGEWKPVWDQKMPFFEGADFFLVQRSMVTLGGTELKRHINTATGQGAITGFGQGAFARQQLFGNAENLLDNNELLKNIGKSLVADALIGNADRFENMNMDNVFIIGNRIGAIDSEAFLSNYGASRHQGIEKELPGYVNVFGTKEWVTGILQGEKALVGDADLDRHYQGNFVDSPPTARLSKLFSGFDDWFDGIFKDFLIRGTTDWRAPAREDALAIPDHKWANGKRKIKEGMDEAMNAVQTMFTGANLRQMKQQFRQYQTQHGGDINFDLRALKIRARYAIARHGGMSGKDAKAQAEAQAAKYARYTEGIFSWGFTNKSQSDAMEVPAKGSIGALKLRKKSAWKTNYRQRFSTFAEWITQLTEEAKVLELGLRNLMRESRTGGGTLKQKADKKVAYLKQDIDRLNLVGVVDVRKKRYEKELQDWIVLLQSEKDKTRLAAAHQLLREFKPAAHELSIKIYYLKTDTKFGGDMQSMWA